MNLSLVPPARTRQRRALTIEKTDGKSPPCEKQRETCAHDFGAKNGNAAALPHRPHVEIGRRVGTEILMTTNTGMLSLEQKCNHWDHTQYRRRRPSKSGRRGRFAETKPAVQ